MELAELIETAARHTNRTQKQLAADMGKKPARLSEWKTGKEKPDANEIAYLAQEADLPVLETVARIEAQLNPAFASIWLNALRHRDKPLFYRHGTYARRRNRGPKTGLFSCSLGWSGRSTFQMARCTIQSPTPWRRDSSAFVQRP